MIATLPLGDHAQSDVDKIEYPLDNGEPLSNDPTHFNWIVDCVSNFKEVFRGRPDVTVLGDVLWYPVEGQTRISRAPDVMIIIGRGPDQVQAPYKQWVEGGIAPQIAIEFISKNNTEADGLSKLAFYERYGVKEYYIYDYIGLEFFVWLRQNNCLIQAHARPFRSQLSGVEFRFDPVTGLSLHHPDGSPFESVEQLRARAKAEAERAKAEAERARDAEQRAQRLAEQLRAAGIDPEA